MNKKFNTFLFMIAATVVNIILLLGFLLLGFVFITVFLSKVLTGATVQVAILIIFIASTLGAFFIYHKIIQFLSKKIDMDKYFYNFTSRKNQK